MYLPSNASTACSRVMPLPISSRMIKFKRSSMLLTIERPQKKSSSKLEVRILHPPSKKKVHPFAHSEKKILCAEVLTNRFECIKRSKPSAVSAAPRKKSGG